MLRTRALPTNTSMRQTSLKIETRLMPAMKVMVQRHACVLRMTTLTTTVMRMMTEAETVLALTMVLMAC